MFPGDSALNRYGRRHGPKRLHRPSSKDSRIYSSRKVQWDRTPARGGFGGYVPSSQTLSSPRTSPIRIISDSSDNLRQGSLTQTQEELCETAQRRSRLQATAAKTGGGLGALSRCRQPNIRRNACTSSSLTSSSPTASLKLDQYSYCHDSIS